MKIFQAGILFFAILFLYNGNAWADDICGDIRSEEPYNKGIINLSKHLYNEARTNFESALIYDPNCVIAIYRLGITYGNLVSYQDSAVLQFKKVQDLISDKKTQIYYDAVYNEGIAYHKMGRYKESIAAFQKVLDLDPAYKDLDKLYNYLGGSYYFLNDYKTALKQFKKAVGVNKEYQIAKYNIENLSERITHYNLGATYIGMGNFREAEKELKTAIGIDNEYFDAHLELGILYIKEGRFEESANELIKCEKINPEHRSIGKVYMNLGVVYYNQGSPKTAINYLKKALKADPENEVDRKALERILQNKYDDGHKSFDQTKGKITETESQKKEYVKNHMEIAWDYFDVGLYEKAISICNEVLSVDFTDKEAEKLLLKAYTAQADKYIDKKDHSNAIKALKRIIKITPENAEIWFKLGKCYFNMPGEYWDKEAEGAFKKVISTGGSKEFTGDSRYYLAQIFINQKNIKDAKNEIEISIRENPDKPELYLVAAKIYGLLNMLEEAVRACEKCLELNPENEECRRLLSNLGIYVIHESLNSNMDSLLKK